MFSIVSLTQEINSEMFLADLCSFTFSLCSPHCCLPVSLFSSSSPRIGFCHGLFLAFLCSSGSWPRFVSALIPTTTAGWLPPLLCPRATRARAPCPAPRQELTSGLSNLLLPEFEALALLPSSSTHPTAGSRAEDTLTFGVCRGKAREGHRSQPVDSHLLLCLPNTHLAHFLLSLFTRSLLVTYNIWHYLTIMFVFAEPDLAADSHGGWLKCTVCLNNLVKDYTGNILKRSTISFLLMLPTLNIWICDWTSRITPAYKQPQTLRKHRSFTWMLGLGWMSN